VLRAKLKNAILYRIWCIFVDPPFAPLTKRIAQTLPKFSRQTVLQIGTNDGDRDDPISPLLKRRRMWRGILVEPLPNYMKQLKDHYGKDKRFSFEQVAIGVDDGMRKFFHICEDARHSPDWKDYFDRIGSLDKNSLIINLGDRLDAMEKHIVESDVQVMTIKTLLEKNQVRKVDAIIVDAEGRAIARRSCPRFILCIDFR